MTVEFNKYMFACNSLTETERNSLNVNDYPNLDKNCKMMNDFDEKKRADLNYIDATNIQQMTWLHIFNLTAASAILLYSTSKVM